MDPTRLSVDVLAEWVITGRDIQDLIREVAARHGVDPTDFGKAPTAILGDFQHLQGTNLSRLRGLRGTPERLRQEIAGILRW